jgi:hypothetical protein
MIRVNGNIRILPSKSKGIIGPWIRPLFGRDKSLCKGKGTERCDGCRVPCGSTEGLQLWITEQSSADERAGKTVAVWGDLDGCHDIKPILDWLEGIVRDERICDAVLTVHVEDGEHVLARLMRDAKTGRKVLWVNYYSKSGKLISDGGIPVQEGNKK